VLCYRNTIFLDANQNELDWCGFSDFDFIKGKGAKDFTCPKKAEIYIRNDQDVINSKKGVVVIEPSYDNKTDLFLTYKAPLLNQNAKIIGIFGVGYDLNSLVTNNSFIQARILHEILLLAGPSVEKIFKHKILEAKQIKLGLSKRQIECLELLVRGMTYTQIAHSLCLSKRTIEHYIEAIKIKWDCGSRSSLIDKFLNS
jgi:DNA-binding CsgD family transcriptional regulator